MQKFFNVTGKLDKEGLLDDWAIKSPKITFPLGKWMWLIKCYYEIETGMSKLTGGDKTAVKIETGSCMALW